MPTPESQLDKPPQAADTQEIPTPRGTALFTHLTSHEMAIARFLMWAYNFDENDTLEMNTILTILKDYRHAHSI